MPDFQYVSTPFFSPTRCCTCASHKDRNGFVDLLVDTPVTGRLYICATCLFQAGHKVGMLDPTQSDTLIKKVKDAQTEILELSDELEKERNNKTVPLKELKKLLATNTI